MSEIILYTTDDGTTKVDLRLEGGTVWLSQQELAELFQTTKQNISKHIKAIFEDQELEEGATVNQKLTVQTEGDRKVSRHLAQVRKMVEIGLGAVHKSGAAKFLSFESVVAVIASAVKFPSFGGVPEGRGGL